MNYELNPYNGPGANYQSDTTLDRCREIERQLDGTEEDLNRLQALQSRSLADADEGDTQTNRQIEALNNDILNTLSRLTSDLKLVAQRPDAGSYLNLPQVKKVESRLKDTATQFRSIRSGFQASLDRDQIRRFRIVFPQASADEARDAINGQQGAVFNQALMNSNRQGQARSVLRSVEARHQEIMRIERQMMELGELFHEMNIIVARQEPQVVAIESRGQEIEDHTQKATVELGKANDSARAARRKKWWCLWIVVAIILIIGIIIVILVFSQRAGCQAAKALAAKGGPAYSASGLCIFWP